MTPVRVTLVLVLVMVAVLLAAGCAAGPDRNSTESANPTVRIPSTVTTEILAVATSRESICPPQENIPNSIISGETVTFQNQIPNLNIVKKQIWLFGPATAMKIDPYYVYQNMTNLTFSGEVSENLKNGTYQIIFQYPDESGQYNVAIKNPNYPDWILNKKGDLVLDTGIVRKGGMSAPDAANILEKAISAGNSGKYERTTLNVTEAWIQINPVRNYTIGDKFSITGTTNLASGEELAIQWSPVDFRPSGIEGPYFEPPTTRVQSGSCGINTWSFDLDSSTFMLKEYYFWINSVRPGPSTYAQFFMESPSQVTAP